MKISILLFAFFLNVSYPQTVQPAKTSKLQVTHSSQNNTTLNLTITALIEALFVHGGTSMSLAPSVTIELHDATSKDMVESCDGTLNTSGVGTFSFSSAVNGIPYYIVIKSMNTLETWSAHPQSFIAGVLSYDFTTDANKAYTDGSNPPMALHNGKWCIYSGDLNQDGFISGDDFTGVDNDNTSFDYHPINDLNGDGFVSGDDCTFIDNNNYFFISKQIPVEIPDFIVYAGQIYHTILIGNQWWLKENLNVGTLITVDQDQTDNGVIEKYCYYDDTNNCAIYGGLYQWNETMQYGSKERTQGICPAGWHIPSIAEFSTLNTTVGGNSNALKALGEGTGGGEGTNTSGFSALIAGCRLNIGFFYDMGENTYFWSSSNHDDLQANYMYMNSANSIIYQDYNSKIYGFSVRCIKN
ncbi:MAG: FISUMP domain-containing protein [Ignavibacteriaceae bacterium]|nr:FISUMP domain-containing protein [Ignavibacteriaceae bacterium]